MVATSASAVGQATAAEAPYVLDGLVAHGCGIEPATHYADTGGASDHVFALAHLLGFRFVPRLRDLADRRLGLFPGTARPEALAKMIGRPFKIAAIRESWDEIVRLAASVKAGVKGASPSGEGSCPSSRCCMVVFPATAISRMAETLT